MVIGNYFKRIFPDVNHARRDASLEISVQQSVQRGFAMYLARERINTKINYSLRVSYSDGGRMKSREICDLGPHPEQFIVYPYDGTSFYFDPALIKQIEDAGVKPETESLERVFWPFLHLETRRVIEMFSRPPMSVDEALSVMGFSGQDPSKMTIPSMTRQYRVMAQQYHPDKGGDHDQFIRLNRAFQDLLKKVKR